MADTWIELMFESVWTKCNIWMCLKRRNNVEGMFEYLHYFGNQVKKEKSLLYSHLTFTITVKTEKLKLIFTLI